MRGFELRGPRSAARIYRPAGKAPGTGYAGRAGLERASLVVVPGLGVRLHLPGKAPGAATEEVDILLLRQHRAELAYVPEAAPRGVLRRDLRETGTAGERLEESRRGIANGAGRRRAG